MWSSCRPQLNRLDSSGSGLSHTILVPIPYVQGVPLPSIRAIYLIAPSKPLGDGGQTPSWFTFRYKWLHSQKESPRPWQKCHGSHTRYQPQVQFNFILLLNQPKTVTSWNQPHFSHPLLLHTHMSVSSLSHCVSLSYFPYDTY